MSLSMPQEWAVIGRKFNMQASVKPLTIKQVASILQINERTVSELANNGVMPHTLLYDKYSNAYIMRFELDLITDWLRHGPLMSMEEINIEQSGIEIQKQFTEELKILKQFENQISYNRQPKYFSLSKVKNKRCEFLYYVRYIDTESRRLVPSRWCTHTKDRDEAEKFAIENRDRILREYQYNKNESMYAILSSFYKEGSTYLDYEQKHGRILGAKNRAIFHNFAKNVLIPFLRSVKVKNFEDITPPIINELQNFLLEKGNKPQTINRYMGCLKSVLNYMVMHGRILENVFSKAIMLRVTKSQQQIRSATKLIV